MSKASSTLVRVAAATLTAVILAWAAVVGWLAFDQAASLGRVGSDLDLYVNATRGWLAGGSFYPAHQLAGPYVITPGDILYPPTSIPLFVPFLIVPYAVFAVIPIAVVGWVVLRMRPRPWAWPLMAACLAFTPTLVKIIHLNPAMWVSMAVGLALVWAWPGVLVLLKPSLAPFALIGIHRRSWWVSLAVAGCVALLFLPMWPDFFTVLLNSRNPQGLLYSLDDVPMVVIPLIAWVARRRPMPVPVNEPDPLVLATAT